MGDPGLVGIGRGVSARTCASRRIQEIEMHKRLSLAGAAAILMLAAAPLSIAQISPTQPTAPPARPAPASPPMTPPSATPTDPASPGMPATPATPARPGMTPSTPQGDAADEAGRTCRTRKDVGQACSCASAPTEMGTARAPDSGTRNVCVVPRQ